MTEIPVYNMKKEKVGSVEFPAFEGKKVNTALLHQVVVAQQTNRRQGNAKVKTRHEVAGSTRKIYRQKGTGGARHGDIKAPLFVGGGQTFGPKPKNYDVRLPQKIRRAALREAVRVRQEEGRLWILDQLQFDAPKTKKAAELFSIFEIEKGLVVLDQSLPHVEKSTRNLSGFKVCRVEGVSVRDILAYQHLVLTRGPYERLRNQGQRPVEGEAPSGFAGGGGDASPSNERLLAS